MKFKVTISCPECDGAGCRCCNFRGATASQEIQVKYFDQDDERGCGLSGWYWRQNGEWFGPYLSSSDAVYEAEMEAE